MFNPKVVQATMGSISRVNCSYLDLNSFLLKTNKDLGTYLKGKSIYKSSLEKNAIYLFEMNQRVFPLQLINILMKKSQFLHLT